jgi:hypothetical protein
MAAAWRNKHDKETAGEQADEQRNKAIRVYLAELSLLQDQADQELRQEEWAEVRQQQQAYESYLQEQRIREEHRQHLADEMRQAELRERRRELHAEVQARQLDVDAAIMEMNQLWNSEQEAQHLYYQAKNAEMQTWDQSRLHEMARQEEVRQQVLYHRCKEDRAEARCFVHEARARREEAEQRLAACPKPRPPVYHHGR